MQYLYAILIGALVGLGLGVFVCVGGWVVALIGAFCGAAFGAVVAWGGQERNDD